MSTMPDMILISLAGLCLVLFFFFFHSPSLPAEPESEGFSQYGAVQYSTVMHSNRRSGVDGYVLLAPLGSGHHHRQHSLCRLSEAGRGGKLPRCSSCCGHKYLLYGELPTSLPLAWIGSLRCRRACQRNRDSVIVAVVDYDVLATSSRIG